jgi:hypothetical protein
MLRQYVSSVERGAEHGLSAQPSSPPMMAAPHGRRASREHSARFGLSTVMP